MNAERANARSVHKFSFTGENIMNVCKFLAPLFAVLVLTFVYAFTAQTAYADNCDTSYSQITGTIKTDNGIWGVPNMTVYGHADFGGGVTSTISTVTDSNGDFTLTTPYGFCTTWSVAPDSLHPSNTYGNAVDADEGTATHVSQSGIHVVSVGNLEMSGCNYLNNSAAGVLSVYQGQGVVSGTWVVALNPRTDVMVNSTQADSNGSWGFYSGVNTLNACTYYKIVPYFDPNSFSYASPAFRVIHTSGEKGSEDIGLYYTVSNDNSDLDFVAYP